MIPVRVNIRDFLCYDHAPDGSALTFDFEGSRLWSITGDNGAGKSAIFDAIRYALYGQHRDGSQRDGRVIRRGASSCEISFEFRVHDSLYRVRRTVQRAKGKSAIEPKEYQAARYDESQTAWLPIPGTDKQQGLDDWVRERIGLEYGTFIASVLLLQGESDKLIQAASKDRFTVLSGLLSLDAYERLADAAKERARADRSQADQIDASLEGSPTVRPEDLEVAGIAVANADDEMAVAQDAVALAAALLKDATSYAEGNAAMSELEAALAQVNAVLERASDIRERHAEWSALSATLPRARQALSAVQRGIAAAANGAQVSAQAKTIDLTALETMVAAQAATEKDATRDLAAAAAAVETATLAREALAPQLAVLEQHKSGEERIATLLETLGTLDKQLADVSTLEERYGAASRMREALPLIKSFVALRSRVNNLHDELAAARKGLDGLAALEAAVAAASVARDALPLIKAVKERRLGVQSRKAALAMSGTLSQSQAAVASAEELAAAAVVTLQHMEAANVTASQALTRAEQQHDDAQAQLKARQDAKGEKLCSRCGQKVSPSHAKLELADAQARVKEAASQQLAAKDASAEAATNVKAASRAVDSARKGVDAARLALAKADAATNELKMAELQMAQILEAIGLASVSVQHEVRVTVEIPDASLVALERAVRGLPDLETKLQALQQGQGRAAALEAQLLSDHADLDRFWGDKGEAAKSLAATQQIIRAATEPKPSLAISEIELRVKEWPAIVRERDAMQAVAGRRASVDVDLQHQRAALFQIEKDLPARERKSLRAQAEQLELERSAGRAVRAQAEKAVQQAQQQVAAARERHTTAAKRHAELESAARESERLATSERAEAELRLEGVPAALSASILRGDEHLLKDANERLKALANAEKEHLELLAATQRQATLRGKADATASQLEKIPENHRVTIADGRAQQAEAAARLLASQKARDSVRERLRDMRAGAERRKASEADYARLRKSGILFQRLSDLLGRKGLQAVLMDDAIAAIARLANETLGHISGGEQQVLLERVTSARGEDIKISALDLGSTDEALDVAFLSGSQMFRVSVALAAGIGQFAAGAGQIRALIIDEGFGSLDAQGRLEMVEELRKLSEILDRVIVVSHQEDFQDRTLFPTGYVLRKSNQRTEIMRIV